jgi:hypothetical protein
MDQLPDPLRQYLLWWLALVIAPALVMVMSVVPAVDVPVHRRDHPIWLLPITMTFRLLRRWWHD